MIIKGRAHVFGDDIDTDVIFPAPRMTSSDPKDFAQFCMEPLDPNFADRVRAGDVIFCGENFGCGSSREHAPMAFLALGVQCMVGKSFARIFYRNAFNIGLSLLICPPALDAVKPGDEVEINLHTGEILLLGQTFQAEPIPEFMQKMLASGGLLEYLNERKLTGPSAN